MTKPVLAMMCVSLSAGILAGCATSTMPSADDPSTAIHEDPIVRSEATPGTSTNGPTVASADAPHNKVLTAPANAAK